MFPYLVRIGDLSVPAYPLLYGLGIVAAGSVAIGLGQRERVDARRMAHFVLAVAILIFLGGRLFYVLLYPAEFEKDWGSVLDLSEGGQVHYGGLLIAALGGVLAARLLGLPVWQVADNIAVGIPLGVVLGRLGCFCAGCCFGDVTSLPWGVTFPQFVDVEGKLVGSPAFLHQVENGQLAASSARSLPVHPTQLYEAAAMLVVFAVMLRLKKSGRFAGRLLPVYFATYCCVRFLVEFARANPVVLWGLTVYQILSAVIALSTGAYLVWRSRRLPKTSGGIQAQ